MYGPKVRWLSNQSRQPELAFRNSHEASRRNGVVGSMGRNMPNVANPTQIKAMMFKMIFIFLFLTEVQICFWGLRVLELLISLRGLFCFF